MRSPSHMMLRLALVVALAASGTGCLAAAAGAGAGAGIYLTSRGASGQVNDDVAALTARTRTVFSEMGIQMTATETEDGGKEVEVHGTRDGMDITVEIERKSATTSEVAVSARKSEVEWDKEYARQILSRISGT